MECFLAACTSLDSAGHWTDFPGNLA